MAERFEKRYSLPENLYIKGSPVVIAAGALLKDTVTGKMLVQIKLKNIGTNDIQALKVKIKAYEPNGAEVEGVDEYQYVDLSAGHGEEFGQKTPIYLPNNSTRKFEIGVTEVVLRGAEPWVSEFKQWEPLPNQTSVKSFNNLELEKQFVIEAGEGNNLKQTPDYLPDITLDLFRCTCGDLNPENSSVCLSCGRYKDLVFKATDMESLKEKCDARLQEEKELAEQKAQELAEKKRKTKKLYFKVGIIAGIVLVLFIGSIIGFNIYNNYRKEEIIKNSADQITKNTWKSLDNSGRTISLNKNGGSYIGNEVSVWKYEAPVLNISYVGNTDLYSEDSGNNKVKLTLSWYNDDILQLTTDGESKESFVKESQYDEAIKIKNELETATFKEDEDENGDDVEEDDVEEDDDVSKISSYEAEEKAKDYFKYSYDRILKDELLTSYSTDTIKNASIGSVDSVEKDWMDKYEVVINGSCSIYDKYGDYKDHETFSVKFEVGYDGDVEWEGDTY